MPTEKILTSVCARISSLKSLCLAGILLYSQPAFSQETLQSLQDLHFSAFDVPHGKLLRVFQNHYTLSGVTGDSATSIPAPGIGHMINTYSVHLVKGNLTLTKKGSGPVYQVINGTIQRIDIALDHGFQIESIEFVRNDTLFRHGGRGLWEAHNFLSYFNYNSRQWEIYTPVNGLKFPPGLFHHRGLLDGNLLYLHGGFTINPFNRLEKVYNQEVWSFNFALRQWMKLGTIDPLLAENDGYFFSSEVVCGAERVFIYNNRLVIIHPGKNTLSSYSFDQLAPRPIYNSNASPFLFKGSIYYYDRGANLPNASPRTLLDSIEYKRITLHQLTSGANHQGYVYRDDQSWVWWSILVLPITGILVSLRRRQKRHSGLEKKARLSEKGILYQDVLYELDPVPMMILQLLLARDEDVPSSELLEITSAHEQNYPNKVRIKNRVIRNLNLDLRSIFHTRDDILTQTDSSIDRRIKCYRLDRKYFQSNMSEAK